MRASARIERTEQELERSLVARLLERDPDRPEPVAELPHTRFERVEHAQPVPGSFGANSNPRAPARPSAELVLGRQPVAGRVQLDRPEALGVEREEAGRVEPGDRSRVASSDTTSPRCRRGRLRRGAVVRDEGLVRDGHLLGKELLDRLGVAADLALGGLGARSETKFISARAFIVQKNSVYAPTGSTQRASSRATPSSTRPSYAANACRRRAASVSRVCSASSGSTGSNVYAPGLPTWERTSRAPGRRSRRSPSRSACELVEGADTVSEPLARDEDRAADVEPEAVVLERCPVALAHRKRISPSSEASIASLCRANETRAALTTERSSAMAASSRTNPWSRTGRD